MTDRTALLPVGHSKPIGKYSAGIAVVVGDAAQWVFVSGQVATDEHGRVIAAEDPGKQAEAVFDRIGRVLDEAGGGLGDLVSLVIYLVNRDHFEAVSRVRNTLLGVPAPSSTLVVVSQLAERGCLVEISGIALVDRSRG